MIGSEDAEVGDLIGGGDQPGSASFFEPGVEHVPMSAFDHARANGQAQLQGGGVVQAIEPIFEVAVSVAHGSFFLGDRSGFHVGLQCFHDFFYRAPSQSFLLDVAPTVWLMRSAGLGRRAKIFADVIEVAQEGPLIAEDLPALKPDPIGSVADGMNVTVQ